MGKTVKRGLLPGVLLLFSLIPLVSSSSLQSSRSISFEGVIRYPEMKPQLQWLYVEGHIIRDSEGPIFLVGTNTRGWASGGSYGDDLWTYADQDAENIKVYGFNAVRLAGCYWNRVEISGSPSEFVYDTGYVNNILKAIKAFNDRGIYVILDMHTREDSETTDHLRNFLPMASNYKWDTAFFTETGPYSGREHLKNLWLMWSSHLKDEPGVIYDLLNEPHYGGSGLSLQEVSDHWWDMADYVIDALRANGDNHIVTVNMSPWAQNCGYMKRKLNDDNVVYQPHCYVGRGSSSSPPENTDINYLRSAFKNTISDKMESFNVPYIIGEFGNFYRDIEPGSLDETYLRNLLTVFLESPNMQGYFYWTYLCWKGTPLYSGWQETLMEFAADKPTEVHWTNR